MTDSKKIIGYGRAPDSPNTPLPITSAAPVVHDSDRYKVDGQGLLDRVDFGSSARSHGFGTMLQAAPQLAHIVSDYRTSSSPDKRAECEARFADEAEAFMDAWRSGGRDSKADSDLYALLSPVFEMPELIERIYAEPTLINELPKRALGTPDEMAVYLTYEDHSSAVQTGFGYDINDAGTSTGTVGTATVKLAGLKKGAFVSARDREIHDARRGRMGAMDFDLFGRQIDIGSKDVFKRAGEIVAWGDADLGLLGFIASTNGVTAANANSDSGTGLTDYGVIAAQIVAQAAQVNYMEEFLADTIYIDPQAFHNLTGRLISNTGDSGDSVLSRILQNFPRIQRVMQARELSANAAEITEKPPKVGATEAAKLGGGYLNGGSYKRCMVLTRNDSTIHEWFEGIPLSVVGLEPINGADRAVIRMSTGGCVFYRPNVPRIVYI